MTSSKPHPLVLFCKTYEGDIKRTERLLNSIAVHNTDNIPVFVSAPGSQLASFKNTMGALAQWLADEDIIACQPKGDRGQYASWDGRLSQQVIKSEFWRTGLCDNYLCLDADSIFIRDFNTHTFMDVQTVTPFTVIYQSKELLQLAQNRGIAKIITNFLADSNTGKALFGREGPDYDFSPTPVVWSAKVWSDLYTNYLEPQNKDLWDAIAQFPSELRWYGEALLHYKSIPLLPIEPLFRVYHYDWQYARLKKQGERIETLKALYWGVVMQSNWDFEMDAGAQAQRKSYLSKMARRFKRSLSQFR